MSACNKLLPSPVNRYVSSQSQVSPAGNDCVQTDVLMWENERLRKELEVYAEKAARLQKVRKEEGGVIREPLAHRGCGSGNTKVFLPVHVGG